MRGTEPAVAEQIDSLARLTPNYSALFCDVWGVVHNGVGPFPEAVAALEQARAAGLKVILLTNSPRPNEGVVRQLASLGVAESAWDRVVTSGDVTRDLIRHGPRRVFHIGPEHQFAIFEGLDVEEAEPEEATVIVCTGLFDDETEVPADYDELLRRMRSRDIPMICANPDLTVHRGEKLVYCAGAIAREYALMGGRTAIAGKPHRPIYDAAMEVLAGLAGRAVPREEVLAIGDGMLTDVKGAADYGLDVLYVSSGVHWEEYGDRLHPDPALLADFLRRHGQSPVATLPVLR